MGAELVLPIFLASAGLASVPEHSPALDIRPYKLGESRSYSRIFYCHGKADAKKIVSASSEDIQNSAYATALGETVRSNDASAWIRVRTTWPLETRAGIGKVWVDENADGVQGAGEPGVAGVSIWTEDGEVSAPASGCGRRTARPGP